MVLIDSLSYILFGIIIACVFAEAGYFFGRLFGGNIIPVVALMLYVLLLSTMGIVQK